MACKLALMLTRQELLQWYVDIEKHFWKRYLEAVIVHGRAQQH